MFIDNKYTKIYYQIVERAQSRILDGYSERHHIIPKSIGGPDESFNLVQLTAREHFLCHWLLTKMVKGKRKQWSMVNALGMMMWSENANQERYRVNAKLYEQLKQKHSEHRRWAVSGERNGQFGRKWTDEQKQRISKQNTGRKLTPLQIEKLRAAKKGKPRPQWVKDKISATKKAKALERAALKKGA